MLSISLFSRPTIRIQNLQRVLPLFPPMVIMLLMMCASPSIFPFPLQDISAVVNQNAASYDVDGNRDPMFIAPNIFGSPLLFDEFQMVGHLCRHGAMGLVDSFVDSIHCSGVVVCCLDTRTEQTLDQNNWAFTHWKNSPADPMMPGTVATSIMFALLILCRSSHPSDFNQCITFSFLRGNISTVIERESGTCPVRRRCSPWIGFNFSSDNGASWLGWLPSNTSSSATMTSTVDTRIE